MAEVVDQKQLRRKFEEQIARDIIDECRVQLMLKFRFLDLALWKMDLEPLYNSPRQPAGTDAEKFYFDAARVNARFTESFDELVRDHLHTVLHCVFRHPFDELHRKEDVWWLVCDIIVESAAIEMCGGRFPSPDDDRRKQLIFDLKMAAGSLTPSHLYSLLDQAIHSPRGTVHQGFSDSKINEMRYLFERDNHEPWPAYAKTQEVEQPGDVEEIDQDDLDSQDSVSRLEQQEGEKQELENPPEFSPESTESNPDSSDAPQDDGDEDADDYSEDGDNPTDTGLGEQDDEEHSQDDDSTLEQEWEEISKQIEMNLETFAKEWGDEAGGLIELLQIANRRKYNYSDLLRRFMVTSEAMKISDDEFDYVYYTYGLKLYGNMPLIEPLEYKDVKTIKDFVIGVDTSESCSGDLVKRFIGHTFDILKESEEYGREVNVHIIQCDNKVQADTKITDLNEVDAFMEQFHVRGFGGTDFRPLFDYVEQLKTRGDLTDLRGLIYFTDGLGQYPEKMPDYEVMFVFMDNGEPTQPTVPPWASKVVLDEEGINQFKSQIK
ncbi:MAG: VWA-like domain-containing protein [Coriobacteriia bacterium]|nr:VWA-like domain-containing protein [Coriobacteriia bacterium]